MRLWLKDDMLRTDPREEHLKNLSPGTQPCCRSASKFYVSSALHFAAYPPTEPGDRLLTAVADSALPQPTIPPWGTRFGGNKEIPWKVSRALGENIDVPPRVRAH